MQTNLPAYDNDLLRVHLAMAERALPGPDYYTVLQWIHQIIKPPTYLEIGIRQGSSLRAALPGTICAGIDPEPALADPLPSTTRVFTMTSDDFFQHYGVTEALGTSRFSLAFIDGLHLFEQALRDFINLEKFATSESIVMIHDCLPLDAVTSSRVRSTHFYSGDIWKLAMCLKEHRPDLKMRTIRTGPTGLCLVGNLDPQSTLLSTSYERFVDEYVGLTFDDYRNRMDSVPACVDNTLEAVGECIADLLRNVDSREV